MTSVPRTAANRALKKFLRTDYAYRTYVPDSTWLTGGCWLLAEALRRVLGGALVVLVSDSGPEHVLLHVDGAFVDGDGFSTRAALLRRWRDEEGLVVRLASFDAGAASAAARRGIPQPQERAVLQLAQDLAEVISGG